jgi:hypothetical protein
MAGQRRDLRFECGRAGLAGEALRVQVVMLFAAHFRGSSMLCFYTALWKLTHCNASVFSAAGVLLLGDVPDPDEGW